MTEYNKYAKQYNDTILLIKDRIYTLSVNIKDNFSGIAEDVCANKLYDAQKKLEYIKEIKDV